MSEVKNNSFKVLNDINLKDKVKDKIGLSYLSWADAWNELKKVYPTATWKVYNRKVKSVEVKTIKEQDGVETVTTTESENDIPYFTDGKKNYMKTRGEFSYLIEDMILIRICYFSTVSSNSIITLINNNLLKRKLNSNSCLSKMSHFKN